MRVTLTEGDWDARVGGWRSDAFAIPGAKIEAYYFQGHQADPRLFRPQSGIVLWVGEGDRPEELVVELGLTKDLSNLETQVAVLGEKVASEARLKRLVAGGLVLMVIATAASAWSIQRERSRIVPPQVVPPVEAKNVSALPKQSGDEDFALLKDISVFDLRSWRPVPADQLATRYSPVNYINYLHVRKKRAESGRYIAHYSTKGYALDLRCVTHPASIVRAESPDHPGETTYAIEVDVDRERVDSEFLVVIEATFWNGFNDPKESTASTYTDRDITPLGELALVVLFPESKPFKSSRLMTKKHDEEEFQPFSGTNRTYSDKNNHFIYWSIIERSPDTHYQLQWTW
jgi:hypothetical protein